jgi:putative transposase
MWPPRPDVAAPARCGRPGPAWPPWPDVARRMQRHLFVRRSLRLKDYDYSKAGGYFTTITSQNRATLFGELDLTTGSTHLNDAGKMIQRWWADLPQKFRTVTLDASVVMPDHFHGIVLLDCGSCESKPVSLSDVIHWFKTMTTAEYFRGVRDHGWPAVDRRVWQRGFYDHVIRSESDLEDIRRYIEGNPGALLERYAGAGT